MRGKDVTSLVYSRLVTKVYTELLPPFVAFNDIRAIWLFYRVAGVSLDGSTVQSLLESQTLISEVEQSGTYLETSAYLFCALMVI